MALSTYERPEYEQGDRLPTKEMADNGHPMVIYVRDKKSGIKTDFNSDPKNAAAYKPDGGEAVILDIYDMTTRAIYTGVMWFSGALVDQFSRYIGENLAVRLVWTQGSGNYKYVAPEQLSGAELAAAAAWEAANPDTFKLTRDARARAAESEAVAAGVAKPSRPAGNLTPIAAKPVADEPDLSGLPPEIQEMVRQAKAQANR